MPKWNKADNLRVLISIGYRICVLASGSFTMVITMVTILFFTLIRLSFLHLGQYNGKFINSVSSRIFARVLLPQTGHITRCWLIIITSSFYSVFSDRYFCFVNANSLCKCNAINIVIITESTSAIGCT